MPAEVFSSYESEWFWCDCATPYHAINKALGNLQLGVVKYLQAQMSIVNYLVYCQTALSTVVFVKNRSSSGSSGQPLQSAVKYHDCGQVIALQVFIGKAKEALDTVDAGLRFKKLMCFHISSWTERGRLAIELARMCSSCRDTAERMSAHSRWIPWTAKPSCKQECCWVRNDCLARWR